MAKVAPTMQMRLGPDVVFDLPTLQYDSFKESMEARISEIETQGGLPTQQHHGWKRGIDLSGVRFPLDQGGITPLEGLRALIRSGTPALMTDSAGYVWGEWAVKSLSVDSRQFVIGNHPAQQSWALSLVCVRE
ncbi:phage tail protein [Novispirillum itersonii]|uniref:phage tail protein n=1 Tax=Novispirillum itersonii TaxID=189 RepID=UPI00036C0B96|nr:phage tail protein [Novispirillum itersonii]